MSAFWTAVLAVGTIISLFMGVITFTEWGRARWRGARDFVKFWRTLKKRVHELENPKPRTWDQQHCPVCRKRGHPVDGRGSFRDGHWTVWFMCEDCKPIWPVRMD